MVNLRLERPNAVATLIVLAVLAASPTNGAPATNTITPNGFASPPLATQTASPPTISALSETPQLTTATYGDWTLRCERSTTGLCELLQTVANQGHTVAEVAVGRTGHGQPVHLTIMVPPNVTLAQPPLLATAMEPAPVAELTWRRCLPGGCLAETTLADDTLRRLRSRTEPGQIVFQDAAGHSVTLPFSPRGLPQALDALNREDGS